MKKMFNFAVDGIMSFSIRPLRLATLLGGTVSFFAFIYILYALYAKLILKVAFQGWTSILVSILFLGGIQLLSIGILGEYIGKLFVESKKRQAYIIDKALAQEPSSITEKGAIQISSDKKRVPQHKI